MDEADFNALADDEMARIERALDGCDADLDVDVQPGGVLEVEFADDSKIIINRHSAAREIWIAARSGGFHFRPLEGEWRGTRDGIDLYTALQRVVSEQAGEPVSISRPA